MTGRMLVRCCCIPTKILGSLPYDGTGEIRVPVPGRAGFDQIVLRVHPITHFATETAAEGFQRMILDREIAVDEPLPELAHREYAYKSDDIPIDTLRRIPEFIEAPHDLVRYDYVCPYCFGDLRTCPCGKKS